MRVRGRWLRERHSNRSLTEEHLCWFFDAGADLEAPSFREIFSAR